MKKLLLILGLCCAIIPVNAQEQQDNNHSLQDSHHNLIGYMRNATLFDKNNTMICQFKGVGNGRLAVYDGHQKVVGYVINDKEVQDANSKTIGYILHGPDYSTILQDAQHATIGSILRNGTVEDNIHTPIGYEIQTEHVWASAYYFYFKF